MAVNGLAAMSASLNDLKGFKFDRYTPGDADVSFDIHYSGICHTVLQPVALGVTRVCVRAACAHVVDPPAPLGRSRPLLLGWGTDKGQHRASGRALHPEHARLLPVPAGARPRGTTRDAHRSPLPARGRKCAHACARDKAHAARTGLHSNAPFCAAHCSGLQGEQIWGAEFRVYLTRDPLRSSSARSLQWARR